MWRVEVKKQGEEDETRIGGEYYMAGQPKATRVQPGVADRAGQGSRAGFWGDDNDTCSGTVCFRGTQHTRHTLKHTH